MEYKLIVNDCELRVIAQALEEFFRLRLGQVSDLADDWALMAYDENNPNKDRATDRLLYRRDVIERLLKTTYYIGAEAPSDVIYLKKHERELICEDIWQVIRHQLWLDNPDHSDWTVDAHPPLFVSEECGKTFTPQLKACHKKEVKT